MATLPRKDQERLARAMQDATARHQMGDLDEAARLYRVVLRKMPHHFDALHFLGLAEAQRGHFERAERSLRQAIAVNGAVAQAQANLGNVQRELGQFDASLASYDRALAIAPNDPLAHNGRGIVLMAMDRAADAVANLDAATHAAPDFGGAWHNRGLAARMLGQPDEALAAFEKAIALDPNAPALHVERGSALAELGRYEDALAAFSRALRIDPRSVDALYNRAVALLSLQRLDEALASFNEALAIAPGFTAALMNRGTVLARLGRTDEAMRSFDAALAREPQNTTLLSERAHTALESTRFDVAADAFTRLLARDPAAPYAVGNLLYANLYCCDWRNFDAIRDHAIAGLRAGHKTIQPGQLLAVGDNPADQLAAAQQWAAQITPANLVPVTRKNTAHGRIRLAYVSGDFRDHAVGYLAAGLFEQHDRDRFEVIAVSYGPDDGSALRARFEKAFDRFIDMRGKTDREIAELMAGMESDIAVDLTGYTQTSRPGILALRPAPVQVNFLGYPGTLGHPAIDYIIADRVLIPQSEEASYAEHVVTLPHSYQANDNRRALAPDVPPRSALGLPEHGFVFCCFNANYKITPDVFDVWIRLLSDVPGSVLWMLQPNDTAIGNLRAAASARGIAPERLVFAGRMPQAEHLARHMRADLFLDTLYYNAHTTASDALWAGLPIVTCRGSTFASRVGESLLRAVGLPELIAPTLEGYATLAHSLATDTAHLAAIREKLARQKMTEPLFDTGRFRRDIEAAYAEMHRRTTAGESPTRFAVEADGSVHG